MNSSEDFNPYAGPGEGPVGAQLSQAEKDLRLWGMILHLSGLATFVSGVGFVAPIVVWQVKKNEIPALDQHGKNATNWIISSLIYGAISAVLIFVFLIGIPMLIALGLMAMIFPIIAGIKANNGEVWKYPLTIEFIK